MPEGNRCEASGRSGVVVVAAILLVCALGLGSRHFPIFPAFLGKYPGDALWAWMVFLLLGMIGPMARTRRVGFAAVCVCFLVEFSQLWHAAWIDGIRSTRIGYLILGTTFHPPDLLAYLAGIAVAMACDPFSRRRGASTIRVRSRADPGSFGSCERGSTIVNP